MAGPVDLAAFHRQEEALVAARTASRPVLEHTDGHLGHFGQAQPLVGAIDGIGHGRRVLQLRVDAVDLGFRVVLQAEDVFLAVQHSVAARRELTGEDGCPLRGRKPAAAEELVAAGRHLPGNGVHLAAIGNAGVIGGRGGVVERDAADHADPPPLLGRQLSDALVAVRFAVVHADHAALRLQAAGKGGGRRGRVGHEGMGVIGGLHAHHREGAHVQPVFRSEQVRGLGRLTAVEGGQVGLSRLGLGGGHAVAQEKKDILGHVGQGRGPGQQHCRQGRAVQHSFQVHGFLRGGGASSGGGRRSSASAPTRPGPS